jgi:hypothetical protein
MRLLGLPTPRYRKVPTFGAWWRHLGAADKARSLVGTVRRIRRDDLRRPRTVRPLQGRPELPTGPVSPNPTSLVGSGDPGGVR